MKNAQYFYVTGSPLSRMEGSMIHIAMAWHLSFPFTFAQLTVNSYCNSQLGKYVNGSNAAAAVLKQRKMNWAKSPYGGKSGVGEPSGT